MVKPSGTACGRRTLSVSWKKYTQGKMLMWCVKFTCIARLILKQCHVGNGWAVLPLAIYKKNIARDGYERYSEIAGKCVVDNRHRPVRSNTAPSPHSCVGRIVSRRSCSEPTVDWQKQLDFDIAANVYYGQHKRKGLRHWILLYFIYTEKNKCLKTRNKITFIIKRTTFF